MKFKLTFVYWFLPVFVLTFKDIKSLTLKGIGGFSLGMFVVINEQGQFQYTDHLEPNEARDVLVLWGAELHELVHARQFYRSLGLMNVLYSYSKTFRLRWELEAYEENVRLARKFGDDGLMIDLITEALTSPIYKLDVDKAYVVNYFKQ